MPKRECGESRKKLVDGARLNPKHHNNGQSAAKFRIGKGSTTIPQGSRIQAIGIRSDSRPSIWSKI